MGGGDGKQGLVDQAERQATSQAERLNDLGFGNMAFVMSTLGGKFGNNWGALPGEVARSFDKVRDETNASYRQGLASSAEASNYLARTSGAPVSGGEVNAAITRDALALDQRRRLTLGKIQLEEANAGMSANNGFMRLMMGAGNTGLGLASTYQSQALQGLSGMSDTNPWQGAMGGAASGAGMGAALGPWGALAGAVIGGVGGYMGSR
jgi:hypothetical protein